MGAIPRDVQNGGGRMSIDTTALFGALAIAGNCIVIPLIISLITGIANRQSRPIVSEHVGLYRKPSETLEPEWRRRYPYTITLLKHPPHIIDITNQTIGRDYMYEGVLHYADDSLYALPATKFYFKNEGDKVLFQLTWGE